MTSRRRRTCFIVFGIALTACSRPSGQSTAGTPESTEIVRDSIAGVSDRRYQEELAEYRRGSAVIDSVTRVARLDPIIRTDSLNRVYRWALRPQGVSVADANLLSCLETAMVIRYGIAASDRVVKQLLDTVFRDKGIVNAKDYFWSRAPDRGRLDSESCAPEKNPHPDSISGVALDREPTRPTR